MWRYELARWRENITVWVAWHLPRSLAYWCTIRVMAHATTGKYGNTNPTELPAMDVLERWD